MFGNFSFLALRFKQMVEYNITVIIQNLMIAYGICFISKNCDAVHKCWVIKNINICLKLYKTWTSTVPGIGKHEL